MMDKKISVIVPVYKVEKYLHKCVDSIINQTYQNLEIILVDDGSPDNCGAICDEYAAKDSRVRVIHKENGGVSSARNAGLDICTGDYIGFADSDDWIEPDMYEILLSILDQTRSDMSIVSFSDGSRPKEQPKIETLTPVEARIQMHLGCKFQGHVCTKLAKRECYANVHFPEEITICEDTVVTGELLLKCKKIAFCNLPCYHYVENSTSAIHHFAESHWSVLDACEKLCGQMKRAAPEYMEYAEYTCLFQSVILASNLYLSEKITRDNFDRVKKYLHRHMSFKVLRLCDKQFSRGKKLLLISLLMGRTAFILAMKAAVKK